MGVFLYWRNSERLILVSEKRNPTACSPTIYLGNTQLGAMEMSRNSDLVKRLRNITTGEPVGDIKNYGNGYGKDSRGFVFKIEPAEQNETRRRIAKQKAEGRKEGFTFNVMDNMAYVSSVLTSAQCGYLLVLSTYINYEGMIVNSERTESPMAQDEMLKALRMRSTQRSSLTDFLSVCTSHGLMSKCRDGYTICDGFHFRGKNNDSYNVVRSYITKLRDMASENKAEDVGFIYKLIPYIHKTSNMLCDNPNELTPSKVRKMNGKQLAEVSGVSTWKVSKTTSTMIYRGKSVFARITTATDGTFYMLNPQIFRRSDRTDYDDITRHTFGID